MHLEQIQIENFRLLKNSILDMRDRTTLLVGKNNTGKTSFVVLLEKFLEQSTSFQFSDFPVSAREQLFTINEGTDIDELSIRLILNVRYSDQDDLEILSDFMLDLDASRTNTSILLECKIDKEKLLKEQPDQADERRVFIEKNLGRKYLKVSIYAYDDFGYEGEKPYYLAKRNQLEEKDKKDLSRLINFQAIHARRDVASSEDGKKGTKPLSAIATKYFRKKDESASDDLDEIQKILMDMDEKLGEQYQNVFSNFLDSSRDFLDLDELKVVSNIESKALIENSSQVIYGSKDNFLPEQYNGLGYLNILYLLLQIEMKKDEFSQSGAPLNLLIIEEPEAHTHPQMQYVFADKIRGLIKQIPNLQAILTTHSSHIVAKSEFEDIRYLSKELSVENVIIKNFHTELKATYEKEGNEGLALFKFLTQYLSIHSAELFFASKAIFIEGTTERMLLPWFIKEHDAQAGEGLSSQNITVLEVGANAKAFAPFLEFIGIKTLIITDIDTTKKKIAGEPKKTTYSAHPVKGSTHTSNASLKFFFSAPSFDKEKEYFMWQGKLLSGDLPCKNENVHISYQLEENEYHARSFEDAFISLNIKEIGKQIDVLGGLKCTDLLVLDAEIDFYDLTNNVIDKKSDFAASILFSALTKNVDWKVPHYIMEGLKWICRN